MKVMIKKYRTSFLVIVFAILLLIVTIVSMLIYQNSAIKRSQESAYKSLQDSAAAQAVLFDTVLEEQYGKLSIIASSLEKEKGMSLERLLIILSDYDNSSSLHSISVSGLDGIAYSKNNNKKDVSGCPCFTKAMKGERSLENIDSETFIISIPIKVEGEVKGAVLASYDKKLLENAFVSEAFGKESYSFICDSNGEIIVKSIHSSSLNYNENILKFLKNAQFIGGDTIESLKNDIDQNQSGVVNYKIDGKERYAVYQPMGMHNWTIFNVIPAQIVAYDMEKTINAGFYLSCTIAIISIILVSIIIMRERRNTLTIQQEHSKIHANNERFRHAIENMTVTIWDYDIIKHEIVQQKHSMEKHGHDHIVKDIPESIIAGGYIHPDSAQEFRQMYKKLEEGVQSIDGVFLMQTADRKGWWYEHIQYITIFDDEGKPYKAIGMGLDVTDKQELITASQTDPLTGLLHHKATIEHIKTLLLKNTDGNKGALFVIDIDNFKDVNDNLGHQVGDEILTSVSNILKNIFRTGDIIGRVGGDEFMAFIPSSPDTNTIRKKAFQMVQALQMQYGVETKYIDVSVSVGIAIQNSFDESFENLYHRADSALYSAKNNGRNRYEIDFCSNQTSVVAQDEQNSQYESLTPIQLQTLLENMDGGVMMLEVQETIKVVYLSKSFYKIPTIKSEDFKANSSDLMLMVAPKYRAEFENLIRKGAKSGKPVDFSYQVEDKNGGSAWLHIRAVRIQDLNNTVPMMIAVITDISEIAKTDAMLKAIVDNSPLGICVFEGAEKLKPVFINKSMLRIVGVSKEKFLNAAKSDIFALVDPNEAPALKQVLRKAAKSFHSEEVFYHTVEDENKKQRYMHARGVKIRDTSGEDLFLVMFRDITHQKNIDQLLTESKENSAAEYENKRMEFLFKKSNIQAFEVNISEHTMRCSRATAVLLGWEHTRFENMPQGILEIGAIHPDSEEIYRQLYDDMYVGRPSGSCILRVRTAKGNYSLLKCAYETIFSADGIPLRSIGYSEVIEEDDTLKFDFGQEDRLYELMQGQFIFAVKVNLTKNKVERIYPESWQDSTLLDENYDSFINSLIKKYALTHEQEGLCQRFEAKNISRKYKDGKEWSYSEFKVSADNGKLLWISYYARIHISPYNGDTYMFCYICDIDEPKKIELMLGKKPVKNESQNLYLLETEKSIINLLLDNNKNSDKLCGMVVIRIKNYDEIKSELSAQMFFKIKSAVCRKIKLFVTTFGFVGEIAEDRLIIFCHKVSSGEQFYSFAQKLMMVLSSPNFLTVPQEEKLIYTMGIVCCCYKDANFENMYNAAIKAKRVATRLEPVKVGYINDSSYSDVKHIDFSDIKPAEELQLNRNIQDSQVFRHCAQLIVTSTVPCSQLDNILELIGRYFEADRAYILELPEPGILRNTYEWCENGIYPEMQNLQSVPIKDVPTFQKAYDNKTMFLMYSVEQAGATSFERKILQQQGIESLFICPLLNNNKVFGFVGVDNPRRDGEDAHMLAAISQIIAGELIKTALINEERVLRQKDTISGAKSRSCLTDRISKLKMESMSSTGVYIANIMELANINAKYGMEIGDRSLRSTADLLKSYFGEENIYRFGDSILIAIVHDMTSDKFYKKSYELNEEFNDIFTYCTASGYTWSETAQDINSLISNANMFMVAARTEKISHQSERLSKKKNKIEALLKKAISEDKAIVKLQPKIELKTGKICSAEALIRIINDEGKVVSPAKFIPVLEELGIVHIVDHFVLEKVVQCLAKWQSEGKKLIPISLNFSRSTFIEPKAVELIEDMCNRYNVDKRYIEIEITESLGDLDTQSLTIIANKFIEKCVNLSLDDFGAKYSNVSIFGSINFNTLKMDKSMIDHILTNERMLDIVQSIVELCHKQDIAVVAEGVESEEQLKLLRKIECDIAQGYVINKPISIKDFEDLYQNNTK